MKPEQSEDSGCQKVLSSGERCGNETDGGLYCLDCAEPERQKSRNVIAYHMGGPDFSDKK